MHRYNVDRRPNAGLKLNRQPACVNCNHGFAFKDPMFPVGARCPLILNCGHAVCEICIRTLLRNGDMSVTCSVCSKVSTVSNKVDSVNTLHAEFPFHIYLVGQTVLRSRNRIEDNVVSFATNKNKATTNSAANNSNDELCCECMDVQAASLCRQCEVALCEPCFVKIHKAAKALQKHEKIPLLKKGQTGCNLIFCKDHSEQKLEFFCKDCEVATCAHCFICNHRNHDLVTLKEKNAEIIADLAEAYEEANNILKRLYFTKKKVNNTSGSNTLDEDALQAEKAVTSHFTHLHGLLQIREAELLEEIKAARSCTQSSLQDVSKELDFTIKEVEDIVSMGKSALDPNNQNSYDLIATVSKLKDICELPCHLVLSQDPDETVPYEFVADDITNTVLDHCTVTVPSAKKWYLRTNNELPEDYQIEDIPSTETAVMKTAPVELPTGRYPKVLTHFGKQRHYSDSDMSSTSTDSFVENVHRNVLPKLKEGSVEQVTLCHLLSPRDFYVHRKAAAKDLLYYSQQFGRYAAVKNNCPETVTVGNVYLVKFNTDNKWYRGRIMDMLEDDKVEVYYIDYGNTEKTPIKNLRTVPQKFLQVPGLAMHCSLCDCTPVNGEWSSEAINIMANITSNVEVTMHLFRTSPLDVYEVDLSRKDIGLLSLRDALIFLGLATLSDLTHRVPLVKKELFLEQHIKLNSSFTGLVTTINSPSDFYIQRLDENGKYLENLMDEMNKMYCRTFTEKQLVYTPMLGMPVAAQFSLDQKWYRALVVALPGNRQVEVFYVDYGNSEVLLWDKLRFLHEKFLRMSCQALKCSLCDVAPKQGREWPADVTSWFTTFTDKKPVQVAVFADTKPDLKVVLYEQLPHSDVCINALLVKSGYAMSTGENSTVVDFPRTIIEPVQAPSVSLLPLLSTENVPVKPARIMRKPKRSLVSTSTTHSDTVKSKVSEQASSDTMSCDDDPEDLFRIPVTILNVVSPALFYVSISSQEKQIKKLGAEMAEFYSSVTMHNATWTVDSKCAVMRKSDKKWFRGVIIDILSDNRAKVLLKDIASVELLDMSNLMPLDDKFLTVRDGAVKCHLSGINAPGGQDVWPGITTEIFIEELDKYPRKYMSKMGDILNDSLPVELFVKSVTVGGALEPTMVNWKTINQILVDRGFALPDRNKESQVVTTSELLKELEDRPSTSMEELVTSWLNKTQQNYLKAEIPSVGSQNEPEACKSSASGSSSPNLKLSVKSLDLTTLSPRISVPINDMNSITDWLPAVPFKSLMFTGYPTNIDSDCNIYIQDPSQSKDTLHVIQNALSSRYRNSKPMPHDLFWSPGMLCIAQYFSDKAWYRAKVLKVNDNNTLDVQFVDYGNVENCKASELRKNIFMGHIPIQCHRCATPGIIPISSDGKWPVPTLDFIHGTIVDKMCKVELKEPESENDAYAVLALECPGELDLMELLMSMHYATYFIDCDQVAAQDQEPEPDVTMDSPKTLTNDWYDIVMHEEVKITESSGGLTYTPAILPAVDTCLIEVTGVLTALDFVIQVVDCNDDENLTKMKDDFDALTQAMQKEAETQPPLARTQLGGACCACYTQDDTWYRAFVMEEMEEDKLKVQYVDFGNVEILARDRIRTMKEEWAVLPLQGITVHLWGVHKPRNFNAERTGKLLIECMLSGESPLIMKIQDNIGTPLVQFFNKDGHLVYQPLLDEKLLLSTLP